MQRACFTGQAQWRESCTHTQTHKLNYTHTHTHNKYICTYTRTRIHSHTLTLTHVYPQYLKHKCPIRAIYTNISTYNTQTQAHRPLPSDRRGPGPFFFKDKKKGSRKKSGHITFKCACLVTPTPPPSPHPPNPLPLFTPPSPQP